MTITAAKEEESVNVRNCRKSIRVISHELYNTLLRLCFIAGEYYWKLAPDGLASGYPRLISHRWPGLPGDINAATATGSGLIYFFKGNKYWTYNHASKCLYSSYISLGWPGIPDNVDGAMWGGCSTFYFFKGELLTQQLRSSSI
jgi:hypothetical protein